MAPSAPLDPLLDFLNLLPVSSPAKLKMTHMGQLGVGHKSTGVNPVVWKFLS